MVLSLVTSASALTLRPGKTYSSYVLALQVCLNNKGYYVTEDGKYGDATKAAVIAFQAANGLKIDGIAGPATLAALGYTYGGNSGGYIGATLRKGSSGSAVISLQQGLRALNYPVGNIDGKYGSGTQAAVRLFQQYNGLKVDGVAGSATLSVLYGGNAVPYGGHVNPQPSGSVLTKVDMSTYSPKVGITITAQPDPDVSCSYVWYRDNGQQVGTGKTYKPTNSDVGYRLMVTATAKNSVSSVYSAAVTLDSEYSAKNILNGTVTIANAAGVGDVLKVESNGLYISNEKMSSMTPVTADQLYYAWYVGGTIRGNEATFKIPAGTVGSSVRLVVTCKDADAGEVGSNYCTINNSNGSDGNYTNVVTPLAGKVTMKVKQGSTEVSISSGRVGIGDTLFVTGNLNAHPNATLSINNILNAPDPTEFLDFVWMKRTAGSGTFYAARNAMEYSVTSGDAGAELYCIIKGKGVFNGSVQTQSVTVSANGNSTLNKTTLTGTLYLPGNVAPSSAVTVNKKLNAPDTELDYKWELYRDGMWVTVSTANSYTPTTSDVNCTLRLTISAKADSNFEGSVVSSTTVRVNAN